MGVVFQSLVTCCDHCSSPYLLEQLEPYVLYSVGVAGVTRGPLGVFTRVDARTDGDGKGSTVLWLMNCWVAMTTNVACQSYYASIMYVCL